MTNGLGNDVYKKKNFQMVIATLLQSTNSKIVFATTFPCVRDILHICLLRNQKQLCTAETITGTSHAIWLKLLWHLHGRVSPGPEAGIQYL